MRLFIAEKPDLAKAIVEGLGQGIKQNGFFQCGDDVVTWVYGHMLQLCDPDHYDPKYKKWNLVDLPFHHIPWKKQPEPKTEKTEYKHKQLKIILDLLKKADRVVHAGDPDEEGQLLIDELLEYAKCKVPVDRVLINDNTTSVVKTALKNMKPNAAFLDLSCRAEARSVGDQLYGYNMTRAYSLYSQKKGYSGVLSVGRVQTPILGLIVRRCRAHASHVKQYFYTVSATFTVNGKTYTGRYVPNAAQGDLVDDKNNLTDEMQAVAIADRVRAQAVAIASIKTQLKSKAPLLPYNLLKLQMDASRKFNLTPDDVVNITQSLREKHKLITYNRSDCQFISEEQHPDAAEVLAAVGHTAPVFARAVQAGNPSIKSRAFDTSKVSAHHAIIPTVTHGDVTRLTEDEKNLYLLISRAYLAQFYENHQFDQTEIITQCDKDRFITTSKVVVKQGWMSLYKNDQENEELSETDSIINDDLRALEAKMKGFCDEISADKKATKPLPLYSMAALLSDLTRVAKYIQNRELREALIERDSEKEGEHGGIGTPATRGAIIDNLFVRGFLQYKGKQIISSPEGEGLYDMLPDVAKYPDMTALWHNQQKLIKNKADTVKFVQDLMIYIGEEVAKIKEQVESLPPLDTPKKNVSETYHCKECGLGLIMRTGKKGKKSYCFWGCSGYPNCKQSYPNTRGQPNYTVSPATEGTQA
jgi:DNA topoisomerase-3